MLQEQRRHMILLQMRREEELAAERLLQKFDADEEQVRRGCVIWVMGYGLCVWVGLPGSPI